MFSLSIFHRPIIHLAYVCEPFFVSYNKYRACFGQNLSFSHTQMLVHHKCVVFLKTWNKYIYIYMPSKTKSCISLKYHEWQTARAKVGLAHYPIDDTGLQLAQVMVTCAQVPGTILSYCGHGREQVLRWCPSFLRFSIKLGPYWMPNHNLIGFLFLQKNRFVSITFSTRDTWT